MSYARTKLWAVSLLTVQTVTLVYGQNQSGVSGPTPPPSLRHPPAPAAPAQDFPGNNPPNANSRNPKINSTGLRLDQSGDEPLPTDVTNAVVIIEGDLGRGTGFIAKLHDKLFVVTNQHVLSGQSNITITGEDGTKYPTNGELFGAVDYDVAIISIPAAAHFLEILDDASTSVKNDAAVTVPGNADGQSVVTQTNGKVLGFGPKLVEVDAKFIHGNSGSPIIDRETEKVIGVATYTINYVELDNLKKAANVQQTRWFGYRLDTIKNWEKMDWSRFRKEGKQIAAIEEMTDALIALLRSPTIQTGKNEELNGVIDQFERQMNTANQHNSRIELVTALKSFSSQLSSLAVADIRYVDENSLYSYHANIFKEQKAYRDEIDKVLQTVEQDYFSLQ